MERSKKNIISDINREIEEAKKDILWSDNEKTIEILNEKIERLEGKKRI